MSEIETPPLQQHPKVWDPATLVLLVILCVFGAIIGVQLLVSLGVTPNTAIIGAMAAMIVARVPLKFFGHYRSVHVQNLAQSATSAATFGAANSLLLPIAIPWLFGRPDMVVPMFIGVALAMLLDGFLLYKLFNTKLFPATGAWPHGVAAAESIKAGDQGGKQAVLLGIGIFLGALGSFFKFPTAALGTAFIGNVWALGMLGIGFLLRGYSSPVFGIDINALYIPHGIMAGAGLVALIQIIFLMRGKKDDAHDERAAAEKAHAAKHGVEMPEHKDEQIGRTIGIGSIGFALISVLIAFGSGMYHHMSVGWLIAFMFYAAFAAFVHEMIVGLAAMLNPLQVGVMVPLIEQAQSELNKWKGLDKPPVFAAASPYTASKEELQEAARKLAHQGAEVIVLDCMGYSKTLRDICAEAVDVPVIASSTMVAELTANLL